jgi:hypothetical protein
MLQNNVPFLVGVTALTLIAVALGGAAQERLVVNTLISRHDCDGSG